MRLLLRPHILAWLLTGALAFLVFAAAPLVVVATTRLMLFAHGEAAAWVLTGLVAALKVSLAAALVLTARQALRRTTRAR